MMISPYHLLTLRVIPKSSRNLIEGWVLHQGEEVLKMRVTAAPENGKANDAVLQLLADTLSVAKNRLTLMHGLASRRKIVKIEGWSINLEKKLPPNNLSQRLF